MATPEQFDSLVRYEDGGEVFFGNLIATKEGTYVVRKLNGDLDTGFTPAGDDEVTVSKLLAPLDKVPIFICIGLNYKAHAKEASLKVPSYPVIFTKPSDALSGPTDPILVHPDVQSKLDYEGELCVIIGRDGKNIPQEEALGYVLGYAAGNDVSARDFQVPEASGGQYCYAKSFDGFAPIGPAIWSARLVPDPQKLRYRTVVNGDLVQETGTNDMIWTVKQVIAHLSRGTTLRKGTVIMMGTPSGVGYFRGTFLQAGDVVTVEVDGLGKIENKVIFEK